MQSGWFIKTVVFSNRLIDLFLNKNNMNFFMRRYLFSIIIPGICFFIATPTIAAEKQNHLISAQQQLTALENQYGGRIGLYALDTANNIKIEYHANERFPMYCTAKMMGVSAILKKSMSDKQLLQENVKYTKQDLIEWSPITKQHVPDGMTVSQLCKATITVSDNTAMNLLLKKIGGPKALDLFARSIGNDKFNLKSWWPNEATWQWGEMRDTATPESMGKSLQKVVLGNVLASSQREMLLAWLKGNTVGDARIRAGVPQGWSVADKTGTGFYDGGMGDIGIIWPPKCKPIVLAIYYKKNQKDAPKQQQIIASATRIVLNQFAKTDQCVAKQL